MHQVKSCSLAYNMHYRCPLPVTLQTERIYTEGGAARIIPSRENQPVPYCEFENTVAM